MTSLLCHPAHYILFIIKNHFELEMVQVSVVDKEIIEFNSVKCTLDEYSF